MFGLSDMPFSTTVPLPTHCDMRPVSAMWSGVQMTPQLAKRSELTSLVRG